MALEDKYQYNQKELNSDFGLLWSDYGARWLDLQRGVWGQIDPLAEHFYSESPSIYAGNNPVRNIDVDGKYKLPAEFIKNYPTISSYIQSNIKNDVLGSSIIMAAFSKNTANGFSNRAGNLNAAEVAIAVTWNSGPMIIARNEPGGLSGANGFYDNLANQIEISNNRLKHVEEILSNKNASSEDKLAAFLPLYMTLLHETVHYGDYLDGIRQYSGEPGNQFERDVWGVRIQDGDAMIIVPRFLDQDGKYDAIESIKQLINDFLNSNEEKETLPTIPE